MLGTESRWLLRQGVPNGRVGLPLNAVGRRGGAALLWEGQGLGLVCDRPVMYVSDVVLASGH